MTNYEKYKETIDSAWGQGFSIGLSKEANEIFPCRELDCEECRFLSRYNDDAGCGTFMAKWLVAEYEEPKVDWAKVPIDTPILVKNFDTDEWSRCYFAGLNHAGKIMTWDEGRTSWSALSDCDRVRWEYVKLAEV